MFWIDNCPNKVSRAISHFAFFV